MYEKKYSAGDDIITQGAEEGDEFFVLADGHVDVSLGLGLRAQVCVACVSCVRVCVWVCMYVFH